ncbi:Enhancer of polycomb-like protein 1 [Allomyces javanicus]|nr:Enhancer of polycomb-like protein 1 [Allomyces javanicus]
MAAPPPAAAAAVLAGPPTGRALVTHATSVLEQLICHALDQPAPVNVAALVRDRLWALTEPAYTVPATSLARRIHAMAWHVIWSTAPVAIKETSVGDPARFVRFALVYLDAILAWCELDTERAVAAAAVAKGNDDAMEVVHGATPTVPESLCEAMPEHTLFVDRFADVLDMTPTGHCTRILQFLLDHSVIRDTSAPQEFSRLVKKQLLAVFTSVLRRSPSLLYPDVVSTILRINTLMSSVDEASALNPRAAPNLDNITHIDTDLPRRTGPDDAQLQHRNQFYQRLWRLQQLLQDPRQFLRAQTAAPLNEFLANVEECVHEFAKIAHDLKEHLRNPTKDKLMGGGGDDQHSAGTAHDFFVSKFLTSRELFDAQITDPYFRRQVLVQFLLAFEVLQFYSDAHVRDLEPALLATKRNKSMLPTTGSTYVAPDQVRHMKTLRTRIAVLLSRIPPNGLDFLETVLQLIRHEGMWMDWKAKYFSPKLKLPVPTLAAPTQAARIDLVAAADLPRDLGHPRLNELWNETPEEVPSELPPIDLAQWVAQVEDEARGDLDAEYQLSCKEQWKWQTFRLYVQRHFATMTKPTTQHPIRDLVRRSLGQPDMTDAEREEEEDRRREREEMEREMEEERARMEAEAEALRKEREARMAEKRRREEEERKRAEEARVAAEMEARKKAEEERKVQEEERRKRDEEQRRVQEEQRKAQEEQRRAQEEQRRVQDEQRRVQDEQRRVQGEQQRKLDEDRPKAEDLRAKLLENDRRKPIEDRSRGEDLRVKLENDRRKDGDPRPAEIHLRRDQPPSGQRPDDTARPVEIHLRRDPPPGDKRPDEMPRPIEFTLHRDQPGPARPDDVPRSDLMRGRTDSAPMLPVEGPAPPPLSDRRGSNRRRGKDRRGRSASPPPPPQAASSSGPSSLDQRLGFHAAAPAPPPAAPPAAHNHHQNQHQYHQYDRRPPSSDGRERRWDTAPSAPTPPPPSAQQGPATPQGPPAQSGSSRLFQRLTAPASEYASQGSRSRGGSSSAGGGFGDRDDRGPREDDRTKFRTRKLDARRTLPILRASQLKDLNDATTLTRTLTEVATGVEKEEEKELHLQAAISSFASTGASGVYIPTPDANQTIPEDEYLRLHPRRTAPTTGVAALAAKDSPPPPPDAYPPCLPRSLIRYSTQVEDATGCPYNVDDEDAAWLHAFRDGFVAGKSAVLDSAIATASAPAANAAAVVSPPAKKRARTKSPASPQKAAKAAAAAAAAAAADTPAPPRPALTDDLFERCIHVLEALMNDRTGWMLTTPGFEQELEQADLITISEALAAVQDRPDLAGTPSSPTSASFSSMASLSALPNAARDEIDPVEPVETPFNATALSEARAAGSAAAASALSHITLPLPSPATPLAAHVAWWLPHIYPWWSHRRRTRRNRPLAPIVRIEDPNPRNETDPYVCFRKRETKVMRKTRRSDAQAGTHLRKLRGELAMARALLALVHARESARTQVLVRDRSVFEARVQLRAVKRKLGVNDEKEFERPDYVPPSRATAAAVARAKAIAQAQALQAAALSAAAHAPAALATPNAGPATVKSRASSVTPLEAPARAPRASQPAARAAAAAGTVRGQPLVLPAGRGAAVDDMPSMTELLNRRVDDEFRRRKATEEHFEDVSLFPKHILVGMPPPVVGAATTTPATTYVPPPGVTSRSGSTAAGQIMARQQRVAAATSTPTATLTASATPTAPGTPVPLSTSSSVASLVAGAAAPMPPVPPYLPPSIAYPLAWRAYAAQLLMRGYPSPYAYPPSVTAIDAPTIPPSASAVYSPGAWPSLPAYARLAPGQQHAWLYPYAARSAALAEARSLAGKLKPAESVSQPTSPPTPAAPVLRHPLVHGPAVLTHPTLTGQSTVVLPLPTPEPAAVETTTARSLAGSASSPSTAATTPTASTPSKTLVTRGPPSPSSSPLSNGAVEPPADPPLLMHPSMIAAARSASPAPPLSPASVLGEDPLADKLVAPPAALMPAVPAVGPSPTTTPSDKSSPALPPGVGVGPSGQLFADWLGKDRMILDGDDDEADGEDRDGADEAMDVDGSSKGTPVATWIMRKRVGRNGRVFLERRRAPGTRWGNV